MAKDIIVTFDLEDPKGDDYPRAYDFLSSLGLRVESKNIMLPSAALWGIWHAEMTLEQVRDGLVNGLEGVGLKVKALLVAEYTQFAWLGDKVP